MENFLCSYGIALIVLPIPIGYFWVWVYRNRGSIGLPDWFSGILAQGVISGHKVSSGDADETDYGFIIISTLVTTFIILFGFYAISGNLVSQTAPSNASYIESVTVDYNAYENSQNGIGIHIRFKVADRKDVPCIAAAYFYYESGDVLRDLNGEYTSYDSQVSVGQNFTPQYDNSVFDDLVLFIPNDELHTGTGRYDLKFKVELYDYNTQSSFSTSDYYHFYITK